MTEMFLRIFLHCGTGTIMRSHDRTHSFAFQFKRQHCVDANPKIIHNSVLHTVFCIAFTSTSPSSSFTLPSATLLFAAEHYCPSSLCASTFATNSSSSALKLSASGTIFSISSLNRRPLSFVIVMRFAFPDALTTADTIIVPFSSTANITSLCGTPREAGGIPER